MQQNAKSGAGLTFITVPEHDEYEDKVAGDVGMEEADEGDAVPARREEANKLKETQSPGGIYLFKITTRMPKHLSKII